MGRIGSGKTTASSFFPSNWKIINVDDLGHTLLKKPLIQKQLLVAFGETIFDEPHTISRKKLASIVFTNKKKLNVLNSIIHPPLKKEVERRMHTQKHIVLDCALLLALGLEKKCTHVIEIHAPQNVLFERLKNKYTKQQQRVVMQEQQTTHMPDFIVVNDSGKKEFKKHIRKIITFLYAA